MNIEELTLKQIKEISGLMKGSETAKAHPYIVGKNYLIRTVTMIDVGELVAVYDNELVLSNASWIPDTDRWHKCLKDGDFSECEPFIENAIVGRGGIIDATIWVNPLPKDVK